MGILDSFTGLFRHKAEEKNYLSLVIAPDRVLAGIWTFNEANVQILGFGEKHFSDLDVLTHQAAVAIDSACEQAKSDVSKTVFGLSADWFEEGKLTEHATRAFKKLSEDLELKVDAYVTLALAINHLSKIEESITPAAVLVGVFGEFCEVYLLSNNQVIASAVARQKVDTDKILNLIGSLGADNHDLPTRIILYGADKQLEGKLAKINWKDILIGEPKIDVLDDSELLRAVAYAQAQDILGHEPKVSIISHPEIEEEKSTDEVGKFGFVAGKDILSEVHDFDADLKEERESKPEDITGSARKLEKEQEVRAEEAREEVLESNEAAFDMERDSNVIIPQRGQEELAEKESSAVPILGFFRSSQKVGAAIFGVILLALAGIYVFILTSTSAEVLLKVNPKNLEKSFKADVVLNSAKETQIIGQEIASRVDGSQKTVVTGSKAVGEYATGQVTVFNWTTGSKSFSKGTVVITKNGVKFTLGNDVVVASRSAQTPGQATVEVSAVNFGTEGNIGASSDFTFQEFDELLYSGRADNAFSGGSEKQVTVVTQGDFDKLEKSFADSLLERAKKDIFQKAAGQKLHDEAKLVKIIKRDFDKKLGEEASLVNLDMQLEIGAIVYKEDDLKKVLSRIVSSEVQGGFEARAEDIEIAEINAKRQNQVLNLSGKFKARLVPKIAEESLKEKIAGKNVKEARGIIKTVPEVADVFVNFSPNLPFGDILPRDRAKIKIKIELN